MSTHALDSMVDGEHSKPPDPGGMGEDEEMVRDLAQEGRDVTGSILGNEQIKLARVRQYGEKAKGPYVVYLRAKERHSLNVPKVAADLFKSYKTIEIVDPVNRDKLKILFKSKEEANFLALNKEFCDQFFVYIPAKEAEVSGKILMNDCAEVYQIMKNGCGILDGSSDKIKIIEVSRLVKKIEVNGAAKNERTPFVRVIFEGTVLPDYVILNKLRIPVNPYAPRVMQCKICFRLGHSESHCGNRKRCEQCGLIHENGNPGLKCVQGAYNCPNCRLMYREKTHICPRVDEIKDRAVAKALATREEARMPGLNQVKAPQSKKSRDMKGNENIKVAFDQNFPPLKTRNRYNMLNVEEVEILSVSSVQDIDPMEGNSRGRILKRKNSGNLLPDDDNAWFKWASEHDKTHGRKNARVDSPTETPRVKQNIFACQKNAQEDNSLPIGYDMKKVAIWILKKVGLSDEILRIVEDVVFPLIESIWPKLVSSLFSNHGS